MCCSGRCKLPVDAQPTVDNPNFCFEIATRHIGPNENVDLQSHFLYRDY